MFAGIDWLGVAIGAVASFVVGWWYYSAKGFYKPWSESAGITMERGDPMGASFGSLVVGLVLYSVWVGAMVAQGLTWLCVLGIVVFIVMGYSNNAFKKLGAVSRAIDAGSWALSGVLMLAAQWVF